MAEIIFYEKTGCINNTKQKEILTMAGHQVNAINLIHHDWTKEELLDFFSGLPVKEWFNKNAPAVTSGEVVPDNYTADEAIELMLLEHIFIKRPLLIIGGEKIVGFDNAFLEAKIGLNSASNPTFTKLLKEDLTICPQAAKKQSCD